jgi:DNA polymerase-3 subunit epsilon
MRQVVLDTETTGIGAEKGHRIIEIGCVELVDRKLTGRHYHQYVNPQRPSDEEAVAVHGITDEFLADKPFFEQVAQSFYDFIDGAELVIHNAPFDVGFMDMEFRRVGMPETTSFCSILDTLVLARDMHPGQRNSLDALCRRYGIDNSHRELHGALLDAEILSDVYLMMTGGQTDLMFMADNDEEEEVSPEEVLRR